MPVKRKQYSADQKAKIALTAIKGQQTVNEIAGDFGVHPTQVAQWKKQLLDEAPQVFASGRRSAGSPSLRRPRSQGHSCAISSRIARQAAAGSGDWVMGRPTTR